MPRRKLFRFKLTRKQKRKLTALFLTGLLIGAGLWIYQHHGRFWVHRVAPAIGKPKIVFVIDDIGYDNKCETQLKRLGSKVTYAILPLLPYSRYFGEMSRSTDAEVILHLPLDSGQNKIPGRGLIVSEMPEADILDILQRDLDSVPHHIGVNNHMGSRGTTDPKVMTVILKELKRRRLFFLDSYTTTASVAPEICRSLGLPFLKRGVFLDNDDNFRAIKVQIARLESVARKQGNAIAIGHYRKKTLELLAREIPRLEEEGFEIISLKDLLKIQRD
ncbi:MAG TPA: divergent polysaccharide deacetylase family protein [Candidatus Omnitrophota bacterium]|nr:divergent polysaccharide deacetylase family protein [Candidatus Omnitrophota bacterium]HPS36898.1 divergent polysaccharide deacetylase family protein [Candidatus Omnitrophota bacterium]